MAKEREIVKSQPPLFTTMEMSPYLDLAANKAETEELFHWPAPPYFEFIRSGGRQGPEECLLIFKDGTKAAGRLVDFRPDEALLKFQPTDANVGISVAFSSLLGLRLLGLIQLKPEPRPLGVAEEEMFAPSERQPFNVDLVNGKKLQGETMGFVNALCGLFLYLPEEDSGVTRWFVPAQAIQASSIGAPIGQMLIEQNLASPESVEAALKKQRELRAQKLGEYLTENQIVAPDQLAAALKRQNTRPVLKLGESLIELGFLTESQLEEAQKIQSKTRKMPLGQILSSLGIVNSEVIKAVMAHKLGIPFVNLRKFRVAPEILSKVPARVAYRYRIVPMCESGGGLVVASENPLGKTSLDELRFITGQKMIPVMASEDDVRYALENHYGAAGRAGGVAHAKPGRSGGRSPDEFAVSPAAAGNVGIEELTSRLAAETGELELGEHHIESDSTLVQLVNKIIIDAIEKKASDIHIESNPGETGTRIRFRKDGTLVDYLDLAPGRQNRLRPLRSDEGGAAGDHRSHERRPGRHRDARARGGHACPHRAGGLRRANSCGLEAADFQAAGTDPRVRPDGVGKDHNAPLLARIPQHVGVQDLDGGGPDRNHTGRTAPGPGQSQDRLDFCSCDAQLPAR